jgi:hypothetical protein
MAERYGKELEAALPEADGILGFDHYADISDRLTKILAGENIQAHAPSDRRKLLPIAPAERKQPIRSTKMGEGERVLRKRLDNAPVAPLKIAAPTGISWLATALRAAFSATRIISTSFTDPITP